jgi:hypothetical protein
MPIIKARPNRVRSVHQVCRLEDPIQLTKAETMLTTNHSESTSCGLHPPCVHARHQVTGFVEDQVAVISTMI